MYRIGTGFDVHGFCEGKALILGGVEIPGCRGLEGHSDADVLSHAVADAILGAIGEGDLGKHFPPGNPEYKNVSSLLILSQVARLMTDKGFGIENIDCTVVCEEPKISPHAPSMEKKIADTPRDLTRSGKRKGNIDRRPRFYGQERRNSGDGFGTS